MYVSIRKLTLPCKMLLIFGNSPPAATLAGEAHARGEKQGY